MLEHIFSKVSISFFIDVNINQQALLNKLQLNTIAQTFWEHSEIFDYKIMAYSFFHWGPHIWLLHYNHTCENKTEFIINSTMGRLISATRIRHMKSRRLCELMGFRHEMMIDSVNLDLDFIASFNHNGFRWSISFEWISNVGWNRVTMSNEWNPPNMVITLTTYTCMFGAVFFLRIFRRQFCVQSFESIWIAIPNKRIT